MQCRAAMRHSRCRVFPRRHCAETFPRWRVQHSRVAERRGLRAAHVRPLRVNADPAVVRLTLTYAVGARHGAPSGHRARRRTAGRRGFAGRSRRLAPYAGAIGDIHFFRDVDNFSCRRGRTCATRIPPSGVGWQHRAVSGSNGLKGFSRNQVLLSGTGLTN